MVERALSMRRSFTRRYILGLSIIAVLASVSLAVIYVMTLREESRASILNLATGQRALSQRIAFHVNALAVSDTDHERAELRQELDTSIRAMSRAHDLLTGEVTSTGPIRAFLAPIHNIYFNSSEPFDVEVRRFLSLARSIVDADAAGRTIERASIQELNLFARSSIMQTHDLIGLMLEREARLSVEAAGVAQTVIWMLMLLAIVIEAPLIFNPMGREIESAIRQAKLAEEAARHEAEKARTANEAKSQFLRVMSHELRTPLNAVIGLTELARGVSDDTQREHYLQHVREAGDHMLQLVNDVLDASRITAGKLKLEPAPTDVHAVVESATAMLRARAEAKGLSLSMRGSRGSTVSIDAGRLRQVVINLVGNAVKFTETGSIGVELEQVETDSGEAEIEIRVRDTGVGIPEDKLAAIFEEYEQLGATGAEAGTGLGLSICQMIMTAIGGEIGVESVVGEGSIFTVRFRAEASEPSQEPISVDAATSTSLDGEGLILVVDDNLPNRLIVKSYIEASGYDVLQAENGALAIDACTENERIAAVLMDIDMPVMRGDEATRRLRAMGGRFAKLPIIALTANVLQEDREKLFKAGVDGVLHKPIKRDALLEGLANTRRFGGVTRAAS